jgi:hypothetical protein
MSKVFLAAVSTLSNPDMSWKVFARVLSSLHKWRVSRDPTAALFFLPYSGSQTEKEIFE